jgi:hypothetical protein
MGLKNLPLAGGLCLMQWTSTMVGLKNLPLIGLGCTLLFSVRNIFLPIYSNFSIPAVFLSIPVITAVICSQ